MQPPSIASSTIVCGVEVDRVRGEARAGASARSPGRRGGSRRSRCRRGGRGRIPAAGCARTRCGGRWRSTTRSTKSGPGRCRSEASIVVEVCSSSSSASSPSSSAMRSSVIEGSVSVMHRAYRVGAAGYGQPFAAFSRCPRSQQRSDRRSRAPRPPPHPGGPGGLRRPRARGRSFSAALRTPLSGRGPSQSRYQWRPTLASQASRSGSVRSG